MKINDFYLSEDVLTQMKNAFESTEQFTHVQLSKVYTDFEDVKKTINTIQLQPIVKPLSKRKKEAKLTDAQNKQIITTELQKIIKIITGKEITTFTLHAYAHKDYSMLLDTDESFDSIDIIIDVSDNWDESWGGTYIYADEKGEYIELPANPNSLTIIKTKEDERAFLRYINHYAEKSMRKFLLCSLRN